ncbi:hypothetical protein [Pyruvatibacter mobilis]
MNLSDKDELIELVIDAMADLEEAEVTLRSANSRLAKLSYLIDRAD